MARTIWVSWHQNSTLTVLDFNVDDGVAVVSAGPVANYLHLARDNHASTSSFIFTG